MSLTRLYTPFATKKAAQAALTKFRKHYGVALRGAVVIEHTHMGETEYDLYIPFGGTGFSPAEMKSAMIALVREPNPLSRVEVNSRSMLTGKRPSKRLQQRRKKTETLPAGYYANPLSRVKVGSPSQRPSLLVVSEHGDPSPRLKKRRAKTVKLKRPGAYANPGARPAARSWEVFMKQNNKWERVATFTSAKAATEYAYALHAKYPTRNIRVDAL